MPMRHLWFTWFKRVIFGVRIHTFYLVTVELIQNLGAHESAYAEAFRKFC